MQNIRATMTNDEFERFIYVIGVHQLPPRLVVELHERFVRLLEGHNGTLEGSPPAQVGLATAPQQELF